MSRITVMRSFVAAARAESFNGAAAKLGLTGPAVSRHISDLEAELDARLITRQSKAIDLTEQGRQYLAFAERILAEIAREDAEIRSEYRRAEGSLSILAPKWTGSGELASAVASFAQEHPQITVRFDVGGGADGTYDFLSSGYDVEFHTKELRDSAVRVRQIARLPFALCASRDYLGEHAPPQELHDLSDHRCVVHENETVWHLRRDGRNRRYRVGHRCLTSNTYLALRTAVLDGLGIGLIPARPIVGELARGEVQIVLPQYEPPPRPLFVAYPPGLQSERKLRAFLDYMATWYKVHGTARAPGQLQGTSR